MSKRFLCSVGAALLVAFGVCAPVSAQVCAPLDNGRLADVYYEGTLLYFDPVVEFRQMTLTISGPCEDIVKTFGPKDELSFDIREIERVTDGQYTWTLKREASIDKGVEEDLRDARFSGEEDRVWWSYFEAGKIPAGPYTDSGSFTVDRGSIIDPASGEEKESKRAGAKRGVASLLADAGTVGSLATDGADGENGLSTKQVISGDLTVYNSLCVGFDCPNSPSFSDTTIMLTENNTRIKFDDTSVGTFPRNDWEIEANSNVNGGASYLGFNDCGDSSGGGCASDLVFAVEAGARQHALYVDSGGRVGFGTSNPVLDLHVVDGDTPGLRLAQDGSSGFGPQTWDIAGNETSFFIRDATNGSTLPFRIRPGAGSNSLVIGTDGQVGVGILSPTSAIHVRRNSSSFVAGLNLENQGGDVGFRLTNDVSLVDLNIIDDEFRINFGGSPAELTLQSDGDLIITGTYTPDYVFEPDYPLMALPDLRQFIAEKGHLPNVPSDAEVKRTGRINLSKFQLTLLEKIEELTLYTLDQEDKIVGLSRQVTDRDEQIVDLRHQKEEEAKSYAALATEVEELKQLVLALSKER